MNNVNNQLLESLISEIKTQSDFDELRDQLLKRGVETLLRAEMTAHLGYEQGQKPVTENIRNGYSKKRLKTQSGEIGLSIPRDRSGTFEPVSLPKHSTMTKTLEEQIILLYSKGMSNSDIIDVIEKSYGIKYSSSSISNITNELLDDIRSWQQRPLEDQYAVVWIDALHYKIRQDGKVLSKACMIALGIDMDGRQDILSISIVEQESATAWASILDDLKTRGVSDILFLCSDNLSGLDKAVEAVYPNSTRQICIVHQIRNSLKHVSYKDRKAIMTDIKAIYRASNEKSAKESLEVFKSNWNHKYPLAIKSWETNWDNLTAFLQYPQEIRKLIYTTNIIESFNASLRKFTRNKKVFPTDDAALKSVYMAFQQIESKWSKSRFGWAQIYNQLAIFFENRIK